MFFVLGIPLIVLQAALGSLVGAVVLRAACALFNRLWGGEMIEVQPRVDTIGASTPDPTVVSTLANPNQNPDTNPFAAPTVAAKAVQLETRYISGVEPPSFGAVFFTCFVAMLISLFWTFVIGVLIESFRMELAFQTTLLMWTFVGSLIAYFFVFVSAVHIGLNTSFGRANTIAGLFVLIWALMLGILVFLFAIGTTLTRA